MKFFSMLCSLTILVFTTSSVANEDVYRLLGLSLEQLLDVKIKTASLTEQTVAKAPAAMTVFTRAEIDRLSVDYLHELLTFVPGYQTARELDYSYQYSVSARGRKTGSSGREVLFLLDGVPVNNPRNGNAGGLFMYPVNQIERVEVMRGPGSALYGSNAITGVVNIISRKGSSAINLGLGELNKQQLTAFYHSKNQNWDFNFSFHSQKDDGQSFKVPDTFTSQLVKTTDPIAQNKLRVSIDTNNTTIQLHVREIKSEDFYNTGRISNKYNFSFQSSAVFSLLHKFSWIDNIDSELSASYVYLNSRNGNQSTPFGAFYTISQPKTDAPLYGYGEFKTSRYRVDWKNTLQIDDKSNLLFGFELRREGINEALGYTNFDLVALTSQQYPITYYGELGPGVEIAEQSSLDSVSIYTQYQTSFDANWFATTGFRYDRYEHFPSRISPRVSIVKQISDDQYIKFLYGEAYRVPNFAEVGFKNTVSVISNSELTHEIAKTWDLIWLKQWDKAQIQLGLFANTFKDPIIAGPINNKRTFINGEKEKSSGVELEVQWQPSKNWFYRATASHFWQLPESAYREARDTLSLHINYQMTKGNLNISAMYSDKRKMLNVDNELIGISSNWLVNGKASYDFNTHWQVSVQVKNVLNKAYYTPASGNSLSQGIPNRGQEWLLTTQYSF